MTNLKQLFKILQERYKIFTNLDETCCYSPLKMKYDNNKYIGSIQSLSKIDEIVECISEEGSSVITYNIHSKSNSNKIKNIFITLLINFDFEPFCIDDNINIVITEKDIFEEDEFEEYDDDDDEETTEKVYELDDEEDVEGEGDEEDVEGEDEDVEGEGEDVEGEDDDVEGEDDEEEEEENKENEEEVDAVEEEVEGEEESKEEVEGEEESKEEVEGEEESKEEVEGEEESKEEEDDIGYEEVDVIGYEEVESKEEEEEYTYDTLSKMVKMTLLQKILDLNITSYNGRAIKRHNRQELIECLLNYHTAKKKN